MFHSVQEVREFMVLRRASIVTVLLLAVVLGHTAGGVSLGLAATSHHGTMTCSNVQLLIHPVTSNGAAGHEGEMYRIYNRSSSSCTLAGFPGVALLGSSFQTLPTFGTRSTTLLGYHPIRLVHLASHRNAYFVLEWATIPTGNEACPNAPYLMIIPPNDRLPVVTYATSRESIRPCGGRLTITPVEPTPFSM